MIQTEFSDRDVSVILHNLAIGSWKHRSDPEFDVVISIVSTLEDGRMWSQLQDKRVIHINLEPQRPGMGAALRKYFREVIYIMAIESVCNIYIHCDKGDDRAVNFSAGVLALYNAYNGGARELKPIYEMLIRARGSASPWSMNVIEVADFLTTIDWGR